MGPLHPIHWVILSLIVLLLLGGYGQIQAALAQARRKLDQRPFFHGMTAATSLALAGAMLLALSLLVDVYGTDPTAGGASDDVSLALAGCGGILVLASFFLNRRPRDRRD